MSTMRQSAVLALAVALIASTVLAQTQWSRVNQRDGRQIGQLLSRIEERSARFQNTFQEAVNRSGMEESARREYRLNDMMSDYQQALRQLRADYNRRQASDADVSAVLDRASRIDAFMQRRQLTQIAESDWRLLRADLDRLASSFNVAWNWDRPGRGAPGRESLLTGTYRVNRALSDNARLIVGRAVRGLPYSDRQRVTDILMRRLEAPEMLAIDLQGRTITLASSRAPQMTFDADGQERVEESPNGARMVRVVARLNGDQLEVRTSGDRSSDFAVTFDPINYGRQLRVTRQLYGDRLNQPIVVRSIYDQTSEAARWDVFTGSPGYPPSFPGGGRSDFIVEDGALLTARLNDDLDTNTLHAGDRFALTVVSPREYEGAVIDGHVSDVNRSGRIAGRAELALNFDSIRLRNGRVGRFEGTLESVVASNGDVLRIDREGTVLDSSQTTRTIERTAIGSAIGAIIGAIAGGGKGAAIGAAVGAGAGAGTIVAQGRNDLRLPRGSEITIRASAPSRRASR
ncbi:MAG TPA: hypothetical protein VLM38_20140 [Blastocatellia bacterium]|nr:hypothetical protein [Blastocatellia bacterium]